jgi:hypothetical protein
MKQTKPFEVTHGMSKHPAYSNWKGMKKRCFNVNDKRYKNYLEKGITVHPDFVDDFPAWLKEIGEKPDNNKYFWSVGRIDNNLSYTYGNMRWETSTQQARNHSKQKNNTSGIVGVKRRTRQIGKGFYTTVTASWKDLFGKSKSKDFSVDRYGIEAATKMAIDYRNKMIEYLNSQGAGYAASHGGDI